ncbi:MAG TPA: glycosyltransferase, partial [Pyrinomonadaceae bacterium]|nr:glycosyltransferase [Pyrinomonadaceae bacterium]
TSDLKRQAKELGVADSIVFAGFHNDPLKFVGDADIFVLPSRYEGFSNALVEALACGVPAVVTDCPSANREVITEGFNGWFAKPDDADDLAAVMIKAIGKIETIDRRAIIEDCRSKYSLDVIIPQYEQAMLG